MTPAYWVVMFRVTVTRRKKGSSAVTILQVTQGVLRLQGSVTQKSG